MIPDHRIFGITHEGQIRANLYHGAGHPFEGSMYSWTVAKTSGHLAHKLQAPEGWDQPLTAVEWDAIDEQEITFTERCDTCGGLGADPGALDALGEPCPDCSGKRTPIMALTRDIFAELRQSLSLPVQNESKKEAA